MIIHLLDLETGKKAKEDGLTPYAVIEGSWSCDCNRSRVFDAPFESMTCLGYYRFIVFDVEAEPEDEEFDAEVVIREANRKYYENK